MGVAYQAVQWNRQKRLYDTVLLAAVACFLIGFCAITKVLHPNITAEILLIRAFAVSAFVLLHVILCIGPLCRLNTVFLPLLYNRRHAGVTMALLALAHSILVMLTYHSGGNINAIISAIFGSPLTASIAGVPFQVFGIIALVILILMAATSHDFWQANLTAPVWKALHMLVYVAYGLLILHVAFGVLQSELDPLYSILTAIGLVTVLTLHLFAATREKKTDSTKIIGECADDGFLDACGTDEIAPHRARIVCVAGERVAIFKYEGKISAVSNLCQHQNGPLGEGKIVDGCITCPWHGYQYQPETGASPPPFVEKVPTFNVRVKRGRILIHPRPNPAGTRVEPARVDQPIGEAVRTAVPV